MRVLVSCECSGVVRDAFIANGHDAWSCDFKPSERPGPHLQCDVLTVLDQGWDLCINHPDCTFLTISAAWAYTDGPYHQKVKPGTLVGEPRRQARREEIQFVRQLWNAPIPHIVIENPIGVLSAELGKPQIVQPWQFGDDASKATCLWLKGVPPLQLDPAAACLPRFVMHNGKLCKRWANQTDSGQNKLAPSANRSADRARTYPSLARAMAEQWGRLQ